MAASSADTLCVRRGNWFYVNYTLKGGNADMSFTYGRNTDEVLIGDWDGDGCDTLCVRRGNHYYINNTLESGNAAIDFTFGRTDDEVLAGDWDGDGYDSLCIRRGNHYYINNTLEAAMRRSILPSEETGMRYMPGCGSDASGKRKRFSGTKNK